MGHVAPANDTAGEHREIRESVEGQGELESHISFKESERDLAFGVNVENVGVSAWEREKGVSGREKEQGRNGSYLQQD